MVIQGFRLENLLSFTPLDWQPGMKKGGQAWQRGGVTGGQGVSELMVQLLPSVRRHKSDYLYCF